MTVQIFYQQCGNFKYQDCSNSCNYAFVKKSQTVHCSEKQKQKDKPWLKMRSTIKTAIWEAQNQSGQWSADELGYEAFFGCHWMNSGWWLSVTILDVWKKRIGTRMSVCMCASGREGGGRVHTWLAWLAPRRCLVLMHPKRKCLKGLVVAKEEHNKNLRHCLSGLLTGFLFFFLPGHSGFVTTLIPDPKVVPCHINVSVQYWECSVVPEPIKLLKGRSSIPNLFNICPTL